VSSVAFTPDGHGLVSGSFDSTLKYWDVSHLSNGPSGRPKSPGAPKRYTWDGMEDVGIREGNSPCTVDFIGHEVYAKFVNRRCV